MRKAIRKVCNEKGFTLIEIVVASLVMIISIWALISAFTYLRRGEARVRELTAEDRVVNSMINNVRANLHLYQVSAYPANSEEGKAEVRDKLKAENLPIAFSKYTVSTPETCKSCPGRMGVLIQPVSGEISSLYLVTIRITHSVLYPEGAKDFTFVASYK